MTINEFIKLHKAACILSGVTVTTVGGIIIWNLVRSKNDAYMNSEEFKESCKQMDEITKGERVDPEGNTYKLTDDGWIRDNRPTTEQAVKALQDLAQAGISMEEIDNKAAKTTKSVVEVCYNESLKLTGEPREKNIPYNEMSDKNKKEEDDENGEKDRNS